MASGIVMWFSDKKGDVFIQQKAGPAAFVHHSGINKTDFKTLYEGTPATFAIEQGNKGPDLFNATAV